MPSVAVEHTGQGVALFEYFMQDEPPKAEAILITAKRWHSLIFFTKGQL